MRDVKRATRLHEVQEELLHLRVTEVEDAVHRRDQLLQAREAWLDRVGEAATPRRSTSEQWAMWQAWAAFAEERARELRERVEAADREVADRRQMALDQWRRARMWGNLRDRVAREDRERRVRQEDREREEAFLVRFAAKGRDDP
ncbi:MAG: hypothetical protein QJR01_05810 [Kyrpidia sp.]|nr:hypothetical protein [Kyrpidia sp.]